MRDADRISAFISGASVGVNDDGEKNIEQNENLSSESVVEDTQSVGFCMNATDHDEKERKEVKICNSGICLQKLLVPGVVLCASCQFEATYQ